MSGNRRPKILQQAQRWSKESFSTLAKTAFVRMPRAVPLAALKITNPNGPMPFKLQLPSRQPGRTVQVFVFCPPVEYPDPQSGDPTPKPNSFPIVMDYHGGGFYLGSCLEQAPFCSKLCHELGAIVIGVDYRMAPFDKFPAAIEDAEDVVRAVLDPSFPAYEPLRLNVAEFFRTQWYQTLGTKEDRDAGRVPLPPVPKIELDIQKIGFSGASSGGNIALNMAINAPASFGLPEWPSPIPPEYPAPVPLLLLYPSLDLRQLPSERFRHERMPQLKQGKEKGWNIDDHLASTYTACDNATLATGATSLLQPSRASIPSTFLPFTTVPPNTLPIVTANTPRGKQYRNCRMIDHYSTAMTARQAYLELSGNSLAASANMDSPELPANSREFSPTLPDYPSQHSGFRSNINSDYSEQTSSSRRSYSPPAWRKAGSGWFNHHYDQSSLSPSRARGYRSKEPSPQYHDAIEEDDGD
ncbi:hypothetical protein D0867_12302, partial [Hortaea werneckii]